MDNKFISEEVIKTLFKPRFSQISYAETGPIHWVMKSEPRVYSMILKIK